MPMIFLKQTTVPYVVIVAVVVVVRVTYINGHFLLKKKTKVLYVC